VQRREHRLPIGFGNAALRTKQDDVREHGYVMGRGSNRLSFSTRVVRLRLSSFEA
jgi:hypothetical protein